MPRKAAISGLMFFCLFFIANSAWGLDFKEGLYEITSKVEMPGMPGQMPPVTITQCMTKQKPVPRQDAQSQNCKQTDMKVEGNTVTWKMECDHQGEKTRMTSTITYRGDSFKGKMTMNMGPQAGGGEMTTYINGRRVGPCQ